MLKHILCFGDSNTHGYCAANLSRYDEDTRWTQLLAKSLGDGYLVIEEGLSGRTSCFEDPIQEGACGLNYILPCLQTHAPISLLIIMLGTNDTKERFGSSAACIGLGLKRLIAKAQSVDRCWSGNTPNILIITPKSIDKRYETTPAFHMMGRECSEKSQLLAHEQKKIARMMNCHYLDANEIVSQVNSIDYIHLDEKGHQELAAALTELIPKIV